MVLLAFAFISSSLTKKGKTFSFVRNKKDSRAFLASATSLLP